VAGRILDLDRLRGLVPRRQRNLLRFAIKSVGITPPSECRLRVGLEQMLTARMDGRPMLRWSQGELRRYRNRLYILDGDPQGATANSPRKYAWDGKGELDLGVVRGRLRLQETREGGIDPDLLSRGVEIRFRAGGEAILQTDGKYHKRLKKILQEQGIVPWMRSQIPLLYAAGRLCAIGNLCVAGDALSAAGEPGLKVIWQDHAPLR